MPNLSNRGHEMPSSPIRKLVPFAQAAKEKGTHVYHLNIGQPDVETPQVYFDAIKNNSDKVLAYSLSQGEISYRKALSEYYKQFDIEVSEDEIMVTTGASEAINFAFLASLDTGDEVIIPEPFYANYLGFTSAMGVNIVPLTTYLDEDFALPSPEEFEEKITSKTKGIMICNPANPTGKLYSREDLELLIDIVKKHDIFLFVDEVYKEFVYDGYKFHSALTLEAAEENVVVFDSVSKKYSACGARIGNVITKNKALYTNMMKFAQARLSPPTLGQIGAEACISSTENYIHESIEEYKSRRDLVIEKLNNMEGVKTPMPHGAFYTIVRLPIDDSENFCKWMLESFEHEGKTVMMAPASGFYASENTGKDEVRIAFVLNLEELSDAMDILALGLKAYKLEFEKAL